MIFDWVKKIFNQKPEPIEGVAIGVVTHYFSKPKVAVVKIKKDKIQVGDTLGFHGHTTNFKQKVDSLEIDHKAVETASKGKEVGLQVKARVRPHDVVYKI